MLTLEHVELFLEFSPCELQDTSFKIHINPLEGPAKNKAAALHKLTFVWKMSKIVVLLWIHSSRQVDYMLEQF